MKRIALFLALAFAATCAPALAAPTIVQAGSSLCSNTATVALSVAPTNGNVVVIWGVGWGIAPTATDSNAVALTKQTSFNSNYVAIFDYVVTGSPTATYSIPGSGKTTCIAEISNVTYPGKFSSNSSSTGLSGLQIGDIIFCAGEASGTTYTWTVSSPASPTQNIAQPNFLALLYGITTASGSNVCTGGDYVSFAAYTAPPSSVGVPFLGSSYLFH